MEINIAKQRLDPLFKWPGGKRWFAKRYALQLSQVPFKRLVEPFAGGMAVSLALKPQKALIHDRNDHLINFYQQVKSHIFSLESTFCTREQYYSLRDKFNALIQSEKAQTTELAKIFWQLNRWGYNGLCRFNQKGLFNVPYGDNKTAKKFDLSLYHQQFKHWTFTSGDFEQISLKAQDLVFCDPPYDNAFKSYCERDFSFEDQIRLVSWLDKYQGPTILMNHPTDRIMELYQDHGFSLSIISAPRSISCQKLGRKPCQEVVAIKNFSWKLDGKEIQ